MTVPNQAAPAAAPVAAAPVTPLSVDERISARARGFLADLDANDDPDQMAPLGHEEQQPESAEPEVAEAQEAETPALPEVPLVEVDIDGEKFTIPEKVKHRVMADKDYRQKTMEVAAQKKSLEALTATAQKLNEQATQLAPYNAQLFALENHARYLDHQLRSGALNDDPIQYNRVQGELAIALRNRDQLSTGLQQAKDQFQQQTNQIRQQAWSQEAPKLFEEFPELSKPEGQQKFAKYVQDSGLPQEAWEFLNYSAAGARLVQKAIERDQMVADQAKSREKLKETVKTLPAVTQSSRAADAGANDKKLREAWKKDGGNINDPRFSQLLRSKLNRR